MALIVCLDFHDSHFTFLCFPAVRKMALTFPWRCSHRASRSSLCWRYSRGRWTPWRSPADEQPHPGEGEESGPEHTGHFVKPQVAAFLWRARAHWPLCLATSGRVFVADPSTLATLFNHMWPRFVADPSTLATLFNHIWPRFCGGPEHTGHFV